jgi:PAS domain S-box-containing protein
MMVAADGAIALAYFSLPLAIIDFVKRRRDPALYTPAQLFSAFIFACGVSHLMEIWTVWVPDYGLQALIKVITAGLSMVTAIAVWPMIPKALKTPSMVQLHSAIESLRSEISKRQSAEEQIQEAQQSLAVTLASIGAGLIATNSQGLVVHMNGVAEVLTGWNEASAKGKSLWEVFVRQDRPDSYTLLNPIDLLVREGWSVEEAHHVILISRGGRHTAIEVKADVTRAQDGAVVGMVIVFRDMSPIVRAELESSRLAAIVESSNDAIIGKLLDGRITSWNRAAEVMFGYTAEEAIGQRVQMLIPADRESEEMRILTNLARGETIPAFDTVRQTKDGRLIQVSLAISPIRDREERIVGASKIVRDVTRQREAERALRESEARLRFTLESAHIGDWELDLTSGTIERSLQHDVCFGYPSLQPEWTLDTFYRHVHPDEREWVRQRFGASLEKTGEWRLECKIIWPDRTLHWIALNGIVSSRENAPQRMVGIVMDVTEQREAEAARLKAQVLEAENEQIQAASRMKSQFLANMSHELRTPLTAIIGFGDLLYKGIVAPGSPKGHEFLGYIGTSGRHLLQLINDVLDLSKVESGKLEFFPERIDLATVLREVQGILQNAIASKQILLDAQIDPSITPIVLDAARLKQILYNYLSNAIKFTSHGGHVEVRASPYGTDHFILEVEDSGIGIAPADLTRLFVQFQQLDAGYTKRHPGSGLGLALTRRLVEAQGGEVGVRSTVGRGSVFYAILNRIHGSDAARLPESGATGHAARNGRVLMIEAGNRERARFVKALSEAGFEVDEAPTAADALRLLRHRLYQNLTLDLRLPDQSGLTLLENIRSLGAGHASQVVSVSMSDADGGIARFAISNILCKPIRSDEIVSAMAQFQLPEPGRPNVMVVDDDPQARELMRTTLTSIGIDAIVFESGWEALLQIDECRPDAIVLDLMMPGLDGFGFLGELARLPRWRDTAVFIWTSMILTAEEYDRLAQSARAIIDKGGGRLPAVLDALRRQHRTDRAQEAGEKL